MSSYSIRQLTYILENYWLLREGAVPFDSEGVMSHSFRSPYESAAIWAADVDLAISKLDSKNPDNWRKISVAIHKSALRRLVPSIKEQKRMGNLLGLNQLQERVIRCFLLNEDKFGGRIDGVLRKMQEILNG